MATVNVRVDDAFDFYVNGVLVFSGSDWTELYTRDLDLAPGDVVAIHAVDTGGPGAAFVDIQLDDGRRFGSGTDWVVSESVPGSEWTSPEFDDSGWVSATSHGTTETALWAGTGDAPPAGTSGEWIWSDDIQSDNEVFLRWTVPESGGEPDPDPEGAPATLNVRVDDAFEFYVNGALVLSGSDWTALYSSDLNLAPGDVIAIHAIDTGGPGAAFVDIQFDDGRRFGSGTDWRVSESVTGSDWTSQSFDDSGWVSATSHGTTETALWAGTGDAPPAGTPGEWIWSDDIQSDNEVYLRWTVPEATGNIAPIVSSALADRTVAPDERFSFAVPAGTFFDANGDALTLSATLADGTDLPGWLSFDPGTGTFSGTPSALETLMVRVTADDGNGGSVYDDFDLTISEAPGGAPATLNVRVDDAFTFYVNGEIVFNGSDWTALYSFDLDLAPGDVIAIHAVDTGGPGAAFVDIQFDDGRRFGSSTDWRVSESVTGSDWTSQSFDDSAWALATSHGTTETAIWAGTGDAPPAGTPGEWIWSDNVETDNVVYLRWTVPEAGENIAPIVSSALADHTVAPDESFSFAVPAGTFFDANGDALALSATLADGTDLPGWLSFEPGTGTFSGTPTSLETLAVRVTADDGNGGSVYDDFDLTIAEAPAAAPATLNVRVDDAFTFYVNGEIVFNGADWTALYSFDLDLAPGDVIAIHGVDTGGPGAAFVDIQFDDGRHFGSGTDWRVSESVSGSDWTSQSFDDSGWVSATSHGTTETAIWAGTGDAPPAGTPGEWIWSDNVETDNEVFLRWTVPGVGENIAPVVSSALADRNVTLSEAFSFAVPAGTFFDANGDALALSATLADGTDLPGWLSFDPGTGSFSGTPSALETLMVRVTADDGNGGSVYDDFDLTVSAEPVAAPATLNVRVDDVFELYVNGALVLSGSDWTELHSFDMDLAPGDVVAIHGVDTGGPGAAFVDIQFDDGRHFGSGPDWAVSESVSGSDWTLPSFDDSAWASATSHGTAETAIWAGTGDALPAGTPGEWIWSDNFETDNEVFLRWTVPGPGDAGDPPDLSFAGEHVAKIVDLEAGFWADAVRIMPLGDSITAGYLNAGAYRLPLWQHLVDEQGLWIDYVGQYTNYSTPLLPDPDNQGFDGILAQQVLANIDNITAANPHDITLILLGTNEVLSTANPIDTVPGRLLNIMRAIEADNPDAKIFLGTLLHIDNAADQAEVDAINDQLPSIITTAQNEGIAATLVDFSSISSADLVDGVHPNAAGAAKMADAWLQAIQAETTESAGTLDGVGNAITGVQSVLGSNESDLLLGSLNADEISGGAGNDRIEGRAGDDEIDGGPGEDVIVGGVGNDVIMGGRDADTFVFDASHTGDSRVVDFFADETVLLTGFGYADTTEAAGHFTQQGADVVFTEVDLSVTFENASLGEVTAAIILGVSTEHDTLV